MSFELSFSEEFFTGDCSIEDIEISESPTSILQSIVSMQKLYPKKYQLLVKEVLGIDYPYNFSEMIAYELLDKVREINTCSSLNSPVIVWLDSNGYNTVKVY
ncbi:MAG: hypothetical protein EHM73_14525 [Chroococcales cyanobacterium metabat2.561]|nr:MAG: hypothetical protein EHM73_14525 [Chroococcales cyanobacterium metabat2.561]